MERKHYILIGLAAVLAALYVIFLTDWFRTRTIHIEHSGRAIPGAARGGAALGNITFSLQGEYRLKSIKVVRLSEYLTNAHAHALWELVPQDNAPRVDGFAYGRPVPGMAPSSSVAEPEPLSPGVAYRLLVEARSARGEHDFELRPPPRYRR